MDNKDIANLEKRIEQEQKQLYEAKMLQNRIAELNILAMAVQDRKSSVSIEVTGPVERGTVRDYSDNPSEGLKVIRMEQRRLEERLASLKMY